MNSLSNRVFALRKGLVAALLLFVSVAAIAQANHSTPQGTSHGTSQAQQSEDYLQYVEEPSGYSTPTGGLHTQPWVYTLTAAGLVLLIGYIYKNNSDRDYKSETGVDH